MPDWRILDVKEVNDFDAQLRPAQLRLVRFMVGEHGPFTLKVPAAEFESGHVRQLLDAEAAQVKGVTGG
jgi:hypothetical protein